MATIRKTTRRARRPSAAAQSAKFQRQDDLRTLQNADEIRRDSGRMRGAKSEAASQKRSLDRVSKR